MKKADIKVGESYATSRNNDWRSYTYSVTKVTVIGEPTTKKSNRYPYKAKGVVPVKDEHGTEYDTETRLLREPWADYAAFKAEYDKARLANARIAAQKRIERGATGRLIADTLEAIGLPLERESIHNTGEAHWLAEHGFLLFLDSTSYSDLDLAYLVAPLAGQIRRYVADGTALQIRGATLLEILGLVETQK